MAEIFKEERIIEGSRELPISLDLNFAPDGRNMPIVVFVHGFKGFKDWGAWNLVADYMAKANTFFVKINLSHNGVKSNDLSDINDPETFGENNFSIELDDIGKVLDWLTDDNEEYRHYYNTEDITLIGHSRGAATCLLRPMEDERVQRVITWSGAFNIEKYTAMEDDAIWRERGYVEVKNGRTGDMYKIGYQFRQDYLDNSERLSLKTKIQEFDQALMLLHGDDDQVAPISNSKKIHQVVKQSLFLEMDGDHVFGASHPWTSDVLPEDLEDVVNESIEFIHS